MNDFTKEELEIILYSVDVVALAEDTDHEQLFNKIQSMIDNYCELKIPTVTHYCCSKCNEEWKDCECDK